MNITNFSRRQGGPTFGVVCGGKRHKRPDYHGRRQVAHTSWLKPPTSAPQNRLLALVPRRADFPAPTNTGPPFEVPDWDKGLFIAKAVMEQSNRPVMQ